MHFRIVDDANVTDADAVVLAGVKPSSRPMSAIARMQSTGTPRSRAARAPALSRLSSDVNTKRSAKLAISLLSTCGARVPRTCDQTSTRAGGKGSVRNKVVSAGWFQKCICNKIGVFDQLRECRRFGANF